MRLLVGILIVLVLAITTPSSAAEAMPVGRTTTSRDGDLVAALIRRSEFAQAMELCRSRLSGTSGTSLARARWSVELARVQTAQQLANGGLSDEQIEQASEPVTSLLDSYRDSNLRVFLQFQEIESLRSACFQDCLSASINGPASDDAQRAIQRGAKLIRESESLLKHVNELRVQLESRAGKATPPTPSDLAELGQRLQIQVVQTMLAITEVFGAASKDQHDAATKALRYAESAIQSLPAGSNGWTELQWLRIEAILRSGQMQRALDEFQSLPTSGNASLNPAGLALRLRLGLAAEQWASVARQLDAFYGPDARTAPSSFEMDLVRLRFLLRLKTVLPEQTSSLGYDSADLDQRIRQWIDTIALRNGEYERRRAEAIVLRELTTSLDSDSGSPASIDPSIVAAQGEDWLRRGEPQRAGELLAAAALADSDSSRAIVYATKSAAAYMANSDPVKAASILYRAAIQHPTESSSPTLAVQAATLLGQTKQTQYSEQVETMLRQSITTWPITGPIAAARSWLIAQLKQQGRSIDAAEVATLNYPSNLTETKVDEIVSLWEQAASQVADDEWETLSQRFEATFADVDVTTSALARDGYRASAAFALEPLPIKARDSIAPELGERPPASMSVPIALFQFRARQYVTAEHITPELQAPDSRWRGAIERRLMRDAVVQPAMRQPVAKLIESWDNASPGSLAHVQRLTWLGRTEQARSAARDCADAATQRGTTIRGLAAIFAASDDAVLKREAVHWLDELASGLPRGSADWHEAKLLAAEILVSSGDAQAARQRAQYILLTQPPQDDSLRKRYESIESAEQSP